MTLEPGTRIADRFRVTGLLARGGMGAVHEAIDERLGRQVAIKVLRHELVSDRSIVLRFEREARTAASLSHPGIAQVLDFGTTPDGLGYLVMERVRGETLSAVLQREGSLAPMLATDLVEQALGALASAHACGIVHRDLKPGNLMVVPTGTSRPAVKVLDFGIAQIVQSTAYVRLTQTGEILGTPAFMAPEQALGAVIDARTDVYAMGVILWCLLTGQRPFRGTSMAAVLEEVLTAVPMRADAVVAGVPAALADVAERAMQKEPARRFASATDMAAALAQVRQPVAHPSGLPPVAWSSAPDVEPPMSAIRPSPPTVARTIGLAAPAPSPSSFAPSSLVSQEVGAASRTLASRRVLAALALVALLSSCGLGAVLATSALYFTGRSASAPTVPAPAPDPSSPGPSAVAPPTPVGAPTADVTAACARVVPCCVAYSRYFQTDPSYCRIYGDRPEVYGVARCQEALQGYRAAMLGMHGDATACEPPPP